MYGASQFYIHVIVHRATTLYVSNTVKFIVSQLSIPSLQLNDGRLLILGFTSDNIIKNVIKRYKGGRQTLRQGKLKRIQIENLGKIEHKH